MEDEGRYGDGFQVLSGGGGFVVGLCGSEAVYPGGVKFIELPYGPDGAYPVSIDPQVPLHIKTRILLQQPLFQGVQQMLLIQLGKSLLQCISRDIQPHRYRDSHCSTQWCFISPLSQKFQKHIPAYGETCRIEGYFRIAAMQMCDPRFGIGRITAVVGSGRFVGVGTASTKVHQYRRKSHCIECFHHSDDIG